VTPHLSSSDEGLRTVSVTTCERRDRRIDVYKSGRFPQRDDESYVSGRLHTSEIGACGFEVVGPHLDVVDGATACVAPPEGGEIRPRTESPLDRHLCHDVRDIDPECRIETKTVHARTGIGQGQESDGFQVGAIVEAVRDGSVASETVSNDYRAQHESDRGKLDRQKPGRDIVLPAKSDELPARTQNEPREPHSAP
jgi:hypothetical protein